MTTYTLLLGNMVPPSPGASPQSRLSGQAMPADGGGPIGPEQYWPQPISVSFDNLLNLLGLGSGKDANAGQSASAGQNLPGTGGSQPKTMDDVIPPAVHMMGAVAFAALGGNPVTAFATIVPAFIAKIIALGPDTSGPPARPGFQVGYNEAGYNPVSPAPGAASAPSEVMTMADWQARQYLEKGFA